METAIINNNQVTAIDWLIERVERNLGDIPITVKEQAKEMEKQQIIDAYNTWKDPELGNLSGINYYDRTYKTK